MKTREALAVPADQYADLIGTYNTLMAKLDAVSPQKAGSPRMRDLVIKTNERIRTQTAKLADLIERLGDTETVADLSDVLV